MHLSEKTIGLLNNFSNINTNFVIQPGNIIKTMSDSKTIVGQAKIVENFDKTLGIYDLREFLGAVALFDKCTIEIQNKFALISDEAGLSKLKYHFTPVDSDILTYPKKDLVLPSTEVKFTLEQAVFDKIKMAARTLGHTQIVVRPAAGNVTLSAEDRKNKTSNKYSVDIPGEYEQGADFELVFNIDDMRFIPGSYEVSVSNKLISWWKNTKEEIEYWNALDQESKYGE